MVLLFSSLRFMVNNAPDELLLFMDLIIFCKQDFYNTNQIPYTSDSKDLPGICLWDANDVLRYLTSLSLRQDFLLIMGYRISY